MRAQTVFLSGSFTGPCELDTHTVLDDEEKDVITGSSGDDWFFFDTLLDRATDLQDEVFANDLEFILS